MEFISLDQARDAGISGATALRAALTAAPASPIGIARLTRSSDRNQSTAHLHPFLSSLELSLETGLCAGRLVFFNTRTIPHYVTHSFLILKHVGLDTKEWLQGCVALCLWRRLCLWVACHRRFWVAGTRAIGYNSSTGTGGGLQLCKRSHLQQPDDCGCKIGSHMPAHASR